MHRRLRAHRAPLIAVIGALLIGLNGADLYGRSSSRWRYIVIHHSATLEGSVARFERYHRKNNHWSGIAYHFVIGNGRGSGNGEVEETSRWRRRQPTGHTLKSKMNRQSIAVCLVGDFDAASPTACQKRALLDLVEKLCRAHDIPVSRVILHRDVNGTRCPGKKFPYKWLAKELKGRLRKR